MKSPQQTTNKNKKENPVAWTAVDPIGVGFCRRSLAASQVDGSRQGTHPDRTHPDKHKKTLMRLHLLQEHTAAIHLPCHHFVRHPGYDAFVIYL